MKPAIFSIVVFLVFEFFFVATAFGTRVMVGQIDTSELHHSTGDFFNENEIKNWLKTYSEEGYHRTGSRADKQNAIWIKKQLANHGYQVNLEPVAFDKAESTNAKVIFKTVVKRILLGMSLLNTESTETMGIKGHFGEAIDANQIPVIYYYVMLPSKKFPEQFLKKNHRRLTQLLHSKKYPGIIVITQGNRAGLAPFNINIQNQYATPVVLVSSYFGSLLERQVKINRAVKLISTIKRQQATAYNVIATLPGKDPTLKPLIFMVSRSAWWNSAAGRGTGVIAWLAIAEKLAQTQPLRPIILVALTGSEIGHLGYDRYIQQHPEVLRHAHAWIYIGENIAANPSPEYYIKTNRMNLFRLTENVFLNNHLTNAVIEKRSDFNLPVPALSVIGMSNGCYHLECDKWPRSVNVVSEMKFIQTLNQIVQQLAN